MSLINTLQDGNVQYGLLAASAVGLVYWLYKLAYGTDIGFIKGIPEIPGSIPFYGDLKTLGGDHATAFEEFGVRNNWPVLQAKLGNRRILVVNSFDAAQEWMVKNATATISRPWFYTFHGLLSTTQGSTIGTSPWDESCKRRRTAVGAVMTRPALQKSAPMLDLESYALIEDMFKGTLNKEGKTQFEVDPRMVFQRQSLNLTLMICFGTRLGDLNDPLLAEILHVAHSVSTFRSTNNNVQDYVPFYRYLPANARSKLAVQDRDRRDVWMNELLDKVQEKIDSGKPISCLSEGLLRDTSSSKLTKQEIRSINVSLVSGGFETLSTTGTAGLAWLATEEGQASQEKVYKSIMEVYSTPQEAWEKCITEEAVPYVVALVREITRFYVPMQLLPPRQTIREFEYRGVVIPKGVGIWVNGQAINHDKNTYGPDAHIIRPERWLETDNKFAPGPPYHYSFGAGSRMCPAVAMSYRVLYINFVRLLLHFKITASTVNPPNTNYVNFNEDPADASAVTKSYGVKLEERYPREVLLQNIESSKERSKDVQQ